jgi:DNA-directed RNA polymerase specialized sigma24 family protein
LNGAPWGALWLALAPRLLSRLGRKLRRSQTPGDAEDLVQEAFLRVLQAEARGRPAPADPAAYLWRVADRVVFDHARDARAQKRGGGNFPDQLAGDEQIADPRPGPEALAILALDA